MDTETRTVLAEMRAETQVGFARIDRYFELSQAQHLAVRGDITRLDEKVSGLDQRMSSLEQRMSALEQSLRSLRDWVTVQFAELRTAIQQLTTRVDRLEHRQNCPHRSRVPG